MVVVGATGKERHRTRKTRTTTTAGMNTRVPAIITLDMKENQWRMPNTFARWTRKW